MREVDLAIVGAGPAGLGAAATASQLGLDAVILDEQARAGGQIYRNVTDCHGAVRRILGSDYGHGAALVVAADAVERLDRATVWQVMADREVCYARDGVAQTIGAKRIVLATGALERPVPVPGWTLPGVMTVGGGQTLLKGGAMVPNGRVVLAGGGPLLLLVATQYLRAGVEIAAIVEMVPFGNHLRAMRHLPAALGALDDLKQGLGFMRAIHRAGIKVYRRAHSLRAEGEDRVEGLSFTCGGRRIKVPCAVLMLHHGVVPNVQITRALGLEHDWDPNQRCWRPRTDAWGETECEGTFVAGDGGGIVGAGASEAQGRLAVLRAAEQDGVIDRAALDRLAKPARAALARHLRIRPLLDSLYAPPGELLRPPDETIVCRCEEVTAGQIREVAGMGCQGPNQAKAFVRCGMGWCQGRFCGLTVSEILADVRGTSLSQTGYFRLRPPVKPVSLGELASMADES